jgi:uncharacterized membrane protein YdjX (TVP38/TMEM64 family)
MLRNPILRWSLLSLGLLLVIIVPFVLFEQPVTAWSEAVLNKESSPWVIAAALVGLLGSDILLPIPSSFVATASGYLLGLWWGTVATWTGLMAGTMVGYALGLRYGRAIALRFVGEPELRRVAAAHERFGDATIVAMRAVPVLAEASVVLAGLSSMPLGRFVLLTALANLGIAVTYATVGAFAVNANSFLLAFAGSILLPGFAMLLARLFSHS